MSVRNALGKACFVDILHGSGTVAWGDTFGVDTIATYNTYHTVRVRLGAISTSILRYHPDLCLFFLEPRHYRGT